MSNCNETEQLVVSYQMGKVGSSSITSSLSNCIQMHSWSPMNPYCYFSSIHNGSLKGRLLEDFRWYLKYKKLMKSVENCNEPIKLIIGIREPVSRNISGYFQSLTSFRDKSITLEQCVENFYAFGSHYLPISWFDIELKRMLGIDIYEEPFNKIDGYTQFNKGNYHILVYQQEKLSSLEEVIGRFLGERSFKLQRVNVSSDKWYSNLNRKFLETYVAPQSYLDSMYSSKYMKHFYCANEVALFRERWGG